jgi:exosome complex component RRP41
LESTPLLDLNYLEDSGGGPDVSVALHPITGKMVLLQADGRLPADKFEEVVTLAKQGCLAVAGFMRTQLLEHTKRLSAARGLVRV